MKTAIRILLMLSFLVPATAFAIHDDPGKTKCLDCHFTLPFDREKLSYTEDVGAVCAQCHPNYPCNAENNKEGFAHPINVQPSMSIPIDMPLDQKNRMTCITCHSYHAEFWDAEYKTELLLRRSKGMTLCYTCHKNFPKP